MSEKDEELELEALRRELDDAFATTRPRPDFEDELWVSIQAQRHAPNKIRDAFAGFLGGIRAVPAVPAAAMAAVLVVAIGVGFFAYSGSGRQTGGTTGAPAYLSDSGAQRVSGAFGRLPTPAFNPAVNTGPAVAPASDSYRLAQTPYFGPASLTWAGQLSLTITSAPVFRYREPLSSKADEFAAGLGAVLDERSAGYLGSYSTRDYKLLVRGTVQSPPQSPAYFIVSTPLMPPVTAAGASPADLASVFLAEHSLLPQWSNTVVIQGTGDKTQVIFIRQFDASGYGTAKLIDSKGDPYGLTVDLNGNKVMLVQGLLPLSLDSANYPIISGDQAIRAALTPSSNQSAPSTPGPAVQLMKAELVYVLAPAGNQSFYEPAFLFSGTFQMTGTTYVMRVLVPAVDPSQRS